MSFNDLEKRYGAVVAYSLLMDMERHVRLDPANLADVDPEIRMEAAISIMNNEPSVMAYAA